MTRNDLLEKARRYADLRWNVKMDLIDVASLFAKVEDSELDDLVPLIVDQHMDGHNRADPLDRLPENVARAVGRTIVKELGYENPCP